jgi:hypothetical protein
MSLDLVAVVPAAVLTLVIIPYVGARVEGRYGRPAALATVVLLTPLLLAIMAALVWWVGVGLIILAGSFAP